MAEVIDFEVKSDIGKATADTKAYVKTLGEAKQDVDDLNESISIQGDVINDLEKDLIKMEAQLAEIPKGAIGYRELEDAIRDTTTELKLEKVAMKELQQDRREAIESVKELKEETKEAGDAAGDGKKGFLALGTGVKAVGTAMKALGIGIIIAAFTALKEAVERNQAAMDFINKIMITVSTTFNQVVGVLKDTYDWVTASSDRFNGLSKVIQGLLTIALTPLKLSFYAIKLGVQQAMLAWEKSFLGSGDTKKIKELTAGIKETKDNIADVAAEAVQAGSDVINNFGDAVGELRDIGTQAVNGLSEISVAANYAMAETTVAAQNSAKLAAAEIQGLIEKYDREAELQRQIRDDVSLTMEERIAANEELGRILDEQAEAMLKQQDIVIAAAQAELDANKGNIDMQVALTEAINERAAIEAQITGFRSEQLTNTNALLLEQQAIEDEIYQKKLEEEEFLNELKTQNMLDSITNLEERALKELEIQRQSAIDEVANYENKEALIYEINKKYDRKEAVLQKKATDAKKKMDQLEMKGKLDLAKGTFDNIATIVGEESKVGKAAAAASATVSALQGATSAFAALAPIPFVGPVLGGIAAAAALVSGYANVKAIYATKGPDGDTGGGDAPPGGDTPNIQDAAAQAEDEGIVAPQMVGGEFELGGGEEPEAAKAYVVTDEMTDSQEQLAGIRRRASV
jgi:hypothetical protein